MNIVEVRGGQKWQRDLVDKTVCYMVNKFFPRHKTLDILVEIVKMNSDAVGFCMHQDRKREFMIEVSKDLGIVEMVTTVVHEMIHVKQWVRNEMDDGITNGRARWKTKTIPFDTDYYDLPWEKEAYRLQDQYAKEIWELGII